MVGERGETTEVSRRGFVAGSVGGVAVGGAAAAAGPGVAGAQDGDEAGDGGRGEVVIDMTDDLVFAPAEETVAPGTTVVWENVGQVGHTVTAYEDEIPGEAEYFASGGFESEADARDAYPDGDVPGGESYEHTFEVEGSYGYFCIPHEGVGMVAALEVTTGGQAETAPAGSTLPESAKTLGVAAVGAFATVLGLAYFFLKYGGEYEEVE